MGGSDCVFIEGLQARAIIGLRRHERRVPQDVLVDAALYTDVRRAAATDDAAHIVDYSAVAKAIVAYVEDSEHHLVEALATAIARLLLAEFPVERVRVRVSKPAAVRAARAVGVEIERTRADLDA